MEVQSKCDMELLAAKEAQVLALKQQLAGKDAELAAKDAEIRALKHMARKVAKGHACKDAELAAKDAEIDALKRAAQAEKQGLRRCTWQAMACHGDTLPNVLSFVFTPCLAKLWTLSKSAHVDLERSWNQTMDLSAVGGNLLFSSTQDLQAFLAQPRWRAAKRLTLPQSWSSTMPHRSILSIALLQDIKRLFPELHGLDILPYRGQCWTLPARCRVFADVFASLQSLKLEIFNYSEARTLLSNLPVLKKLHILLCLAMEDMEHDNCHDFVESLCSLPALEELCLQGERHAVEALAQRSIRSECSEQVAKLLNARPGLRVLEIVPMINLQWRSLSRPLASHQLQSLALYAPPQMQLEDLLPLTRSNLESLRIVRQHLDGSVPVLSPLLNQSGRPIKMQAAFQPGSSLF